MKKSLSLLLSIAMAFSIFASVAMGAEANLSVEAKYQALVEAGIFTGDGDDQAANLDHNMTRAQFAAVLVRAFELSEDAASSNVYVDLDGAGWAAGYIGAVTKAGLMNGMTADEFGPSLNVTMEQLATVLVRAFDLQQSTSGVTGTVSDWARGYVGAALQAGLISAKADYSAAALRADLVESAYVVYEIVQDLQTPEATYAVSGAKQFKVSFNKAVDADKVSFDVKLGTATVATSSVKWSDDNKQATLEFASNLQYGEYTITVKGAAANELSGKVTVEEERVANIEILSDTAPAVVNSSNYGIIDSVNVYYKVTNQYGQDITKTSNVNWNSSIAGTQGISDDVQKGMLTITIPPLGNDQPNFYFRVGTEFSLNGYITASNVTVQKTLKIGEEARATTIEPLELFSTSDKALNVKSDYQNYYVLLNVKDQYGNPIKADKLRGQNGQLMVYSSNPLLVDVNSQDPLFVDNVGPNSNQLGLQLAKNPNAVDINLGGTAVITFSPKYGGGQSATFAIEVKKASEVQNITLSAPTTTVSAGEKVKIPYVATDQDGTTITDPDLLNNDSINLTRTGGNVTWIDKDGVAEIEFTAPDYVGNVTINAFILASGKMAQVNINVRDAKYPAAVNEMKVKDAFLEDAPITVKGENITVFDQYGTEIKADDFFKKYAFRVQVTGIGSVVDGSNAKKATVTENTYLLASKGASIVVKDSQKGNVNFKIDVVDQDGNNVVERVGFTERDFTKGSIKDFNLRIVKWSDIVSFEIGDIKKLYSNAEDDKFTANAETVDVYGKLSGGGKVNIGDNFAISTDTKGIKIVDKKVQASDVVANYNGNETETKGIILAVILKPEDTRNITKEVVISKATPVVSKVELKNVEISAAALNQPLFTKADAANNVEAGLLAGLKATDQYGIEQVQFKKDAQVIISDVTKVSGSSITAGTRVKGTESIAGAKAGDKFTITVVTGGHVVTAKVTVK